MGCHLVLQVQVSQSQGPSSPIASIETLPTETAVPCHAASRQCLQPMGAQSPGWCLPPTHPLGSGSCQLSRTHSCCPTWGGMVDGCAVQDCVRVIYLWVECPLLGATAVGIPVVLGDLCCTAYPCGTQLQPCCCTCSFLRSAGSAM